MKILKSLGSNPWKLLGTLLAFISVPVLAQNSELVAEVLAAAEPTVVKGDVAWMSVH